MDQTVEQLCNLLARSKLRSPEEVRASYKRWVSEAKDQAGSGVHFLKWLVMTHCVTEYQAALLARGRTDDFFLNHYKILDRLGRGRMAGVYKAIHASGQTVAIKVLPPSKAKESTLLARFQREARLAVKLKHPNVVRTFQLGVGNNLNYIVMELLDGETLEDIINRRKKLPAQEAVRIIYQALVGLQHIHEQGMVHRDLKPSNMMLVPPRQPGEPDTTASQTLKVLDIGLGRELFDENALSVAQPAAQLTAEGTLLGTPDYLAPEQARDARSTDIRADIYSMGCVLYHLLTGQTPFPDKNILNQIVRHAKEQPKPLRDFTPGIADGLQQIVSWMMAKDPAQRYPTPERAAQALQMFLVADARPAKPLDETPQMRNYLTWLDTSGREENPAPAPAPPPVPIAKAASANDRPKSDQQAQPLKDLRGKPPEPPAPVGAPTAPLFDVELVSIPLPAPTALSLTRRDWIMLGIGAGATLLAMGIGWLLTKL